MKMMGILLTGVVLLINACEKQVVDKDIPQLYVMNLRFELGEGNPLVGYDVAQIGKSVVSITNAQKTAFGAEFVDVDGIRYLSLTTSAVPPLVLTEVSYVMKNQALFGDEAEHSIVGRWIRENNNAKLTAIIVDGQQLAIERNRNFEYAVVSDR